MSSLELKWIASHIKILGGEFTLTYEEHRWVAKWDGSKHGKMCGFGSDHEEAIQNLYNQLANHIY